MTSGKYLNYNVLLLQMGKLYKIDQSQSTIRKICHGLLRIASVCLIAGFNVGLLAEIRNKGAFDFTSNAMSYAFLGSTINVMFRTVYYHLCDDETANLVGAMNSFFKFKTQTLLEEKTMERAIYISKMLTLIWPSAAVSFIFLFSGLIFFGNDAGADRKLVLPVALPFDWKTSPNYEITYFAQVALFNILVYIEGVTDVFFFASVLLTAEQYKLLGWEFKNIIYTTLISNGIPKDRVLKFSEQFNGGSYKSKARTKQDDFIYKDILEMCETEKFKTDMFANVNRLIEFHQSLVSFSASLDNFFSPSMLMFCAVIGFTSLFMNFIMIASGDIVFMLTFAPITVSVLVDLFFPCLFSTMLSSEVEKLQFDVYEIPWYLCSKECRTNLKFLLHRMSLPFTLTVGKFFNLNLPLFVSIVKTLNSYCIVLYQLTEPKLANNEELEV